MRLIAVAAVAAAGAGAALWTWLRGGTAPRGGGFASAPVPAEPLREAELRDLVALGAALVPADASPGADEPWVRAWVERQLARDPRRLLELRAAAALLDRATGRVDATAAHFWQLPPAARNGVLERLLAAPPRAPATRHFQRRIARPLLVDFYGSPAGWATVGYANHPGVPGDPRAYTRPPGP